MAPARGLAAVCLLGVGLASLAWGGVQSWHLRRATASPAELPPSAGAPPRTEEAPPGTRLLGEVLSVFDATSYNGEWFVLDRRQDMVHRLDSTGTRTMAIGRAGRGPGEFRIPEALAVYQDTLVVAEFDGTVHRFGLDGTFHGRSRLRVDSCLAVGVFDVVAMSEKPIYLVGCVGRGALQQAFVVQETPAGATRKLAAYTKGRERDRELDLEFLPVLGAHPKGFVFGSAFEDCLDVLDMDGHVLAPVCHAWLPRVPLPDDWTKDREEMARSVERAGLSVGDMEAWAPFEQMFGTAGGRLVYRVPVPDRAGQHRLVVGNEDDGAMPVVEVEAPHLFLGDRAVLAAWDDLDGTRIALYPWSTSVGR